MSRVVVDTGVLLRYLIKPGSAIRELVEVFWLGGRIQIVTAPELQAELEDVLARKAIQALITPSEGQVLLQALRRTGEILPALGVIPSYCRDPKDDKFIAAAIAGRAEYLITLDKDLLVIGSIGSVRVVTLFQFVTMQRVSLT